MQKIDSKKPGEAKTISIRITADQLKFLKSKGTASEVIRGLIEKEMKERCLG